ncbi:hypothetical protein EDB83DRAFT_2309338 [Lactarius deliciosus]|nr:hypothetical protein EDB83DRAFT_2309338 [Lactarius deliciosus]
MGSFDSQGCGPYEVTLHRTNTVAREEAEKLRVRETECGVAEATEKQDAVIKAAVVRLQVKKPSREAQRGLAEELDKVYEAATAKVQESAPVLIPTSEAAVAAGEGEFKRRYQRVRDTVLVPTQNELKELKHRIQLAKAALAATKCEPSTVNAAQAVGTAGPARGESQFALVLHDIRLAQTHSPISFARFDRFRVVVDPELIGTADDELMVRNDLLSRTRWQEKRISDILSTHFFPPEPRSREMRLVGGRRKIAISVGSTLASAFSGHPPLYAPEYNQTLRN